MEVVGHPIGCPQDQPHEGATESERGTNKDVKIGSVYLMYSSGSINHKMVSNQIIDTLTPSVSSKPNLLLVTNSATCNDPTRYTGSKKRS